MLDVITAEKSIATRIRELPPLESTLFMPEADYKRYHSFTRLPLSNLEIREKIVILSILTVETKSAKDNYAPSPISIKREIYSKFITNPKKSRQTL